MFACWITGILKRYTFVFMVRSSAVSVDFSELFVGGHLLCTKTRTSLPPLNTEHHKTEERQHWYLAAHPQWGPRLRWVLWCLPCKQQPRWEQSYRCPFETSGTGPWTGSPCNQHHTCVKPHCSLVRAVCCALKPGLCFCVATMAWLRLRSLRHHWALEVLRRGNTLQFTQFHGVSCRIPWFSASQTMNNGNWIGAAVFDHLRKSTDRFDKPLRRISYLPLPGKSNWTRNYVLSSPQFTVFDA